MATSAYEVQHYSIDALLSIMADRSGASLDEIRTKAHAGYFESYFRELQAGTIIVEENYIDRDYLEDYAAYYARCFKPYKRLCTRLHFFKKDFAKQDFEAFLRNKPSGLDSNALRDSYLGFVVVRPLPQTMVGRTCLATYPSDGGRRYFPVARSYTVNLFGIPLEIGSLAFQEQDHAVGACATSALWSAFHCSGVQFQHTIPSPVEITRSANEKFPLASRGLPSSGLTAEQVAGSIRAVGLEPYLIDVSSVDTLRHVLYGYLSGGIPALLILKLFRTVNNQTTFLGLHAVTVTGFSLGAVPVATSMNLRSSRIDKIYVHDDQVGPFARMELDGQLFEDEDGISKPSVNTAWSSDHRAFPQFLLVPLYHKIRIPFESVHRVGESFGQLLGVIAGLPGSPLTGDTEWNIRLTSLQAFRQSVFANAALLASDKREEVLCEALPRFLWRLTLSLGGSPHMDFLFDATDLDQGNFLQRVISYNNHSTLYLKQVLALPIIANTMKSTPAWQIIDGILKHTI